MIKTRDDTSVRYHHTYSTSSYFKLVTALDLCRPGRNMSVMLDEKERLGSVVGSPPWGSVFGLALYVVFPLRC